MKRRSSIVLTVIAVAVVAAVLWLMFWAPREMEPRIPGMFLASLPEKGQQVVLVLAPDDHSKVARLWLMQRETGSGWRVADGPLAVTLGHQGLAWGKGEHTAPPPACFRIKHEGDKCSPAGVFRIPLAFGLFPAAEAKWLKLPYTPLTPSIVGVDDPKSRFYNQIVDNTQVERDWDSNEPMSRHTHAYRWGAFISHNPEGTPGLGSCIFMHLWGGPGSGTSGCTAMSEEDIKRVLGWLDPAKEPRLVQGVEGW